MSYTQMIVPSLPTGAPMHEQHRWQVVVPVERTNLCQNPSFEDSGTIGSLWTISGGSTLTQSTDKQTHGLYSGKAAFNTSTTAAVTYIATATVSAYPVVFSCYVWAPAGKKLELTWYNNSVIATKIPFVGIGDWQRVQGSFAGTITGVVAMGVGKDTTASDATAYTIYLDGVCIEMVSATENELTREKGSLYFDGDSLGFLSTRTDFYWSGAPHQSTSVRALEARNGGVPLDLYADLGFILTAQQGAGLAPFANGTVPAGLVGGSIYQRSTYVDRMITLQGSHRGDSKTVLVNARKLNLALNMLSASPSQPMLLLYQRYDDCGTTPIGPMLKIECAFVGPGAQNNVQSIMGEDFDLRFEVLSAQAISRLITTSQLLEEAVSVGSMGYLAALNRRTREWSLPYSFASAPTGDPEHTMCWVKTTTGGYSFVYADLFAGSWYVYIDGVRVAGTPFNGRIRTIIPDPNANGYVFIGGDFTTPQTRVCRYALLGATSAMGTGVNVSCYQLASAPDGTIVAVGDFTSAGGVANTSKVARWNGSAWTAIGGGATGAGTTYGVAVDNTDNIYVCGTTNAYGGVSVVQVAKYIAATGVWISLVPTTLGVLIPNYPTVIVVTPTGRLFCGGDGSAAAEETLLAEYTGNGWSYYPITDNTSANAAVTALLFVEDDNSLWVGGELNQYPGITLRDGLAQFQGRTLIRPTCNMFPAAQNVVDMVLSPNGETIYMRTDSNSTIISGDTTAVINNGTSRTYPQLTLVGPGLPIEISNLTTGAALRFNYTLLAGETVKINFDPLRLSFISDIRGDISSAILPGSQESAWFLVPGINNIHVFISGSTAATKCYLQWRDAFASIGDALYGY